MRATIRNGSKKVAASHAKGTEMTKRRAVIQRSVSTCLSVEIMAASIGQHDGVAAVPPDVDLLLAAQARVVAARGVGARDFQLHAAGQFHPRSAEHTSELHSLRH